MKITMDTRGLLCDIHRPADGTDCSAKGPSSKHTHALLVGEGVNGPTTIGSAVDFHKLPVFKLVRKTYGGKPYLNILPVEIEGDGTGRFMFGGNFLYSHDSRFTETVYQNSGVPFGHPLPIHDRCEAKDRIEVRQAVFWQALREGLPAEI